MFYEKDCGEHELIFSALFKHIAVSSYFTISLSLFLARSILNLEKKRAFFMCIWHSFFCLGVGFLLFVVFFYLFFIYLFYFFYNPFISSGIPCGVLELNIAHKAISL